MDRAILQEMKKNHFHPVYFLYGSETFLLDETLDWIRHQFEQNSVGDRDWNEVVLDLEETTIQAVLQEVDTPSFFGDRRLIIARNATFLTTAKSKIEHDLDSLASYLQNPTKENTLIITVASSQLDKRKKLLKLLEKTSQVLSFSPLEGSDLQQFVVKRFRLLGVQVEPTAVTELIDLVGNNLRLLVQECKKLAVYVGVNGVVTLQHVSELVTRTLEQDVFRLTDEMAKQNKEKAIQIYRDLIFQKEEPVRILALITRQFRIMLQVKLLSKTGKTEKEIASYLKLHPYPVKLAMRQGQLFSDEQLRTLLQKSIEADQALKSNKIDKELAVERILLTL